MTLKAFHLTAVNSAMAPLLIFAAAKADAQQRAVGGGPQISPPGYSNHFHGGGMHGFHRGFGGVFIIEREVPVEREIVRDATPAEPPAPPPPAPAPRKPYVIGRSYSSLPPNGCLKLIQDGSSYYGCSGEWYRQVGGTYKAVAQP